MTIPGQASGHQPAIDPVVLDGDRGMPSVNAVKRSGRGRVVYIVIFVVLLAIVAGIVWKMLSGKVESAVAEKKAQESSVPARTFTAPALPRPVVADPAPVVPVAEKPALPGMMASPDPATGEPSGPPPATLDKSSSELMVENIERPADTSGTAAPGTLPASDGKGPLDGMLSGTSTPMRKASMLGDRNYILAKGSFINCALQTRLDSTVPGMASCRVTRNVYSDNGRIVLIERGSLVTGEYQANMKQGMERIYVLWTRVKTPYGVVVDLNSPGADGLGGAGLPGHVNNHFWKRFGGAMLLSIIDDAAKYATQQGQDSQTVRFDGTSDAATNMAGIALQSTINIPPTLYKNQGEEVGIFIARDLDFSEVYRVEPR